MTSRGGLCFGFSCLQLFFVLNWAESWLYNTNMERFTSNCCKNNKRISPTKNHSFFLFFKFSLFYLSNGSFISKKVVSRSRMHKFCEQIVSDGTPINVGNSCFLKQCGARTNISKTFKKQQNLRFTGQLSSGSEIFLKHWMTKLIAVKCLHGPKVKENRVSWWGEFYNTSCK